MRNVRALAWGPLLAFLLTTVVRQVLMKVPWTFTDLLLVLAGIASAGAACHFTRGPVVLDIDPLTGQQIARRNWRGICGFTQQLWRLVGSSFGMTPTPIASLGSFVAPDPWRGNAPTNWTIHLYFYPLETGRKPPDAAEAMKRKFNRFEAVGIASADGRYHVLPRVLLERWRSGTVANEALPGLISRLEPRLKRSDYTLVLRIIFAWSFAGFFGGMALLLLIGAVSISLSQGTLSELAGPVSSGLISFYAYEGGSFALTAVLLSEPLLRRRRDRRIAALVEALLAP